MAKVVIVIPTYNEREQTPRMIEALAKFFETVKKHDMHLLYADDTSPDKTYEVVREYMKKYEWLHLSMNEEKAGIGGAYSKAFKYAMSELNADYILEFDSDFQHRVEDIPTLLAKIDEEYDLVIGSRYVAGGSIPEEWGIKRKFFSVVGNLVCRVGFLMPGIHDFTTGFKLTKVKGNLDSYNLDGFYSSSFAYKIQMTAEMKSLGKKITEVPIQFMSRKTGESKLIKNELGDFLRVIFLFQLNNPKMRKFIKFGTVGFIGYVINAISLELFSGTALAASLGNTFGGLRGTALGFIAESSAWAAALAAELAIINNFVLNNIWTFKDVMITKPLKILLSFLKFNLASVGAIIIQFIVVGSMVMIIGDTRLIRQIGILVAMPLVLAFNYTMYNVFIWKTWNLGKIFRKK